MIEQTSIQVCLEIATAGEWYCMHEAAMSEFYHDHLNAERYRKDAQYDGLGYDRGPRI